MKKLIYIFLILLSFSMCTRKGNGTDYKENYDSRVLMVILARSTPDPKTKCVEMGTSAGKCIYIAKDKSSLASFVTEEIYSAGVLSALISSSSSTYSDYCDKYIISSSFQNYSDEAKVCNLSCQKSYWDKKTSTVCSETSTTDLVKGLSTGIISCIKNCFQVTNN